MTREQIEYLGELIKCIKSLSDVCKTLNSAGNNNIGARAQLSNCKEIQMVEERLENIYNEFIKPKFVI